MSRFAMLVLHFTVSSDRLAMVSEKYHLIEEDGTAIPGACITIDNPPLGKIGFYLYYFEIVLRVPLLAFSCQVVGAYIIQTC